MYLWNTIDVLIGNFYENYWKIKMEAKNLHTSSLVEHIVLGPYLPLIISYNPCDNCSVVMALSSTDSTCLVPSLCSTHLVCPRRMCSILRPSQVPVPVGNSEFLSFIFSRL